MAHNALPLMREYLKHPLTAVDLNEEEIEEYPRSTLLPLHITERLPRPDECFEGQCWWYDAYGDVHWTLLALEEVGSPTYWLPYDSLPLIPLPDDEAENLPAPVLRAKALPLLRTLSQCGLSKDAFLTIKAALEALPEA